MKRISNFKFQIENFCRRQAGFSVIEIILAAAIFMILATGAITVILQGLDSNRLGEEQTVSNQFAAEGIEALRSIKNQAYSNLAISIGTGVIRSGSNVWAFSGANNQFGPSNKYTRVLTVSDVQRDVSGNIVSGGGTIDPLTKKVTSTVSWNFTPSRANSVQLSSYLSDWRKPISPDGGPIIYAEGTVTTPRDRTYSNASNAFTTESSGPTGSNGRNFAIRTSPTKLEAIAGYVSNTGILQIMCFDGSTWTNEWTATVGGTGTTKRFDIAYETNSGDMMVLYSTNATTNELDYRTKSGSLGCGSANWIDQSSFDSPGTTSAVYWVKMAWDKRADSNLITAIWADGANDLQGAIWNGSSWVQRTTALETSLEVVGTSTTPNVDDFDAEFESSSGDILVVWAN